MKKLFYIVPAALLAFAMTSCKLDYYPSDELNSETFLASEEGVVATMDGCYSLLKDESDYLDYPSGNTYIRHYFQLAEFPSDNVCNSNRTTDKLYEANTLTTTPDVNKIGVLWWIAYKVCFTANTIIEKCESDPAYKQIVGEAYFLRAMMHFHLVTLYAKPYTADPSSMGVVLRLSTNTIDTKRATVEECYNQIVADLKKAAEMMGASRGNAGYASREAALGLLSRVYLYMGQNNNVIDVVENQLGMNINNAKGKLDADFGTYFSRALSSSETMFCSAHTLVESRTTSSIGSMYTGDGGGWGEIYPSDPLLALYERYPDDVRYSAYIHAQINHAHRDTITGLDTLRVYFAGNKDSKGSRFCSSFLVSPAGDDYTFINDKGTTYYVKTRKVHGEYPQWYVANYDLDGVKEDVDARIMPWMFTDANNRTFPMYWVTRFSGQDGDPMLSSPVFIRWGEVVLNLAEAYAKEGRGNDALALVNIIRTRAGIPATGMFTSSQMHGYDPVPAQELADGVVTADPVLNVVLDERRMELAFEGHRMFDQVRNKLNMDRRFSGVHVAEIVNWNDYRIQYPIPSGETTTSGIPQNPGY